MRDDELAEIARVAERPETQVTLFVSLISPCEVGVADVSQGDDTRCGCRDSSGLQVVLNSEIFLQRGLRVASLAEEVSLATNFLGPLSIPVTGPWEVGTWFLRLLGGL